MMTFSEQLELLVEANLPELRDQFELGIPKTVISHDMKDVVNKDSVSIPNTLTYIPSITTSEDIARQLTNGFSNLLNGHKPYN